MPTLNPHENKPRSGRVGRARTADGFGLGGGDAVAIVRSIRAGFPYKSLAKFQKATELRWPEISRFVAIPQRTLNRRQSEGRLRQDESDRVWRASRIFGLAVDLFEGDVAAARKWMQTPQKALGGETPLDFASTEAGAREVENLIGRLEHGVFS